MNFQRGLGLVLVAVSILSGCTGQDPEVAKREHVRRGDEYVAKKQDREAVIEYRNAVQLDPQYGEARQKLADAYVRLGDTPNAFREAIRAADLLPDDLKVQLTAGNFLLLAGKFEDAKSRADGVLRRENANIEALLLRANALAGLKKVDEAIADVEAAIRTNPSSGTSYAALGNMRSLQGASTGAEDAFKRAISVEPQNISARLAIVNFYWAASRLPEAEKELTAALEIDGKHAFANRMLSMLYVRTGRLAAAEAPLKRLVDNDASPSNVFALADYYVATKRIDDARRVLSPVAEKDGPAATGAKTRLAALDTTTGDYAKAGVRAGEVLASHPTNPQALLVQAKVLQQGGKLDEALKTLQQAAEVDPRSAPVQMALGRVHQQRGEFEPALKAFTAAAAISPLMFTASLEAGKLHLAAGRIDDAEQFATAALKAAPSSGDAQLLMARVQIGRGRVGRAESTLKTLVAAAPSAGVYAEMGLLELARNNKAAARAAFEKALELDPLYLNALTQVVRMDLDAKQFVPARMRAENAHTKNPTDRRLAILAASTNIRALEYDRGERLLKEAIERDPNNLEAYLLLSRLYFAQKRLPEAAAKFQTMAEKQPGNAGVQTAVGMFYTAMGRKAEARAKYEQIVQAHPDAGVAANNLAWIYAEEGIQLDMALQLAQAAKALLPERGDVSDTLGWVYHKKGMSSFAVQPLLEAVEIEPRNAQYRYHLGVVYRATGDMEKSRAMLRRALELSPDFDGAEDAKRVLASLSAPDTTMTR